MNHRV